MLVLVFSDLDLCWLLNFFVFCIDILDVEMEGEDRVSFEYLFLFMEVDQMLNFMVDLL